MTDWEYYAKERQTAADYGYEVMSLMFPSQHSDRSVKVVSWSSVKQAYNTHIFPGGFTGLKQA